MALQAKSFGCPAGEELFTVFRPDLPQQYLDRFMAFEATDLFCLDGLVHAYQRRVFAVAGVALEIVNRRSGCNPPERKEKRKSRELFHGDFSPEGVYFKSDHPAKGGFLDLSQKRSWGTEFIFFILRRKKRRPG